MPTLSSIPSYTMKSLPPGTVIPYGSSSLPSGFLACNGAAVSRATYASLFAAIGTNFGVGDGSTTFNLPDSRGLIPRGVGSQTISSVLYDGSTIGTKRRDRTNSAGLTAATTSIDSCSVGNFDAAHTHSWSDRFFNEPIGFFGDYSISINEQIMTNYSNVEVGRTTGNPNVSLNHTHTVATNTVSSSTTLSGDLESVPGYLTTAFIIKV